MSQKQEHQASISQEAYLLKGGGACPQCTSGEIDGHALTVDDGMVSQPCTCNACGSRWADVYRLAGYVRDGAGGEADWDAVSETEITVKKPTII